MNRLLLICCFLVGSLTACASGSHSYPWKIEESTLQSTENIAVQFSITNGTVSNAGAEIRIVNNSENRITFGYEYRIQILVDNKWYDICVTQDFPAEMIYLDPGAVRTEKIEWENSYGKLPTGTYRIWRDCSAGQMSCVFII